jgi:hypothetical protein
MKISNLALDVDGVLANFLQGAIDKAHEVGLADAFPCCWREVKMWNLSTEGKFLQLMKPFWQDAQFWLELNPLPRAPRKFQPEIYLTARPIESTVTEQWLLNNGFPTAPVVTVSKPDEKLAVLKERGLWLIDDHHETVEECLKEGIKAYLFKAPHQAGYDVGHLPIVTSVEQAVTLYEKGY